jgi:hypothetical protein
LEPSDFEFDGQSEYRFFVVISLSLSTSGCNVGERRYTVSSEDYLGRKQGKSRSTKR